MQLRPLLPLRRFRLILCLVLAATLAACGGSSDDSTAADQTAEESESSSTDDQATEEAESAEPEDAAADDGEAEDSGEADGDSAASEAVSIDHAMGTTVLEGVPERIVSLNVQWTDALLALGITPTAYMLNAANGETDVYPWQVGLLDGVEQISTSDAEIPYEAIAALQPDLILGTYSLRDEAVFETLAAIAPTIGLLGDLQVDPWADQVEVLGRALRAEDDAAAAISAVDDQAAEVAAELPGLAGKTYTFANYVPGTGIYVIADPDDGASRLFNALGMEIDPDIVALDAEAVGRVLISFEEIALLDADLVGILLNGEDAANVIGLAELPSSQNGTLINFAFADIVGLNTPTPLSIPYLLELMRPTLDVVAEG